MTEIIKMHLNQQNFSSEIELAIMATVQCRQCQTEEETEVQWADTLDMARDEARTHYFGMGWGLIDDYPACPNCMAELGRREGNENEG